MAPKKRSQRAAKDSKTRHVKATASITPRPSSTVPANVEAHRRSSSLQGFSHQASPRASVQLPHLAHTVAVGGVATAEAVEAAERVLAQEVYTDLPEWFDGADYDVNAEGEIIGVAARRFADSISLERDDDDGDDDDEEDVTERPSLLAQRRRSGTGPHRASPPPASAAGQKRKRAASPSSLSPPPRLSSTLGARLRDPFVNDNEGEERRGHGGGSQRGARRQSPLRPPPSSTSHATGGSRQRRSRALAPEAHPLFFHHFDAMTPIRVRVGVVPLPHAPGHASSALHTTASARSGLTDESMKEDAGAQPHRHRAPPRVSFVERFLSPRKFFQLPSTSPSEPPVDILGWSGVYSALPVWLPATTPAEQTRLATWTASRTSTMPSNAAASPSSSSWWGRWAAKVTHGSSFEDDRDGHPRAVTTVETAASVAVVLSP